MSKWLRRLGFLVLLGGPHPVLGGSSPTPAAQPGAPTGSAGGVASPVPPAGEVGPILPLAEVKAGMKGIGRTVFQGDRIEEFGVEVLGVLDNAAPRRSIIVARLEGGPLAVSGVIAGMSGSPVYIDGRLVGAVSSGFQFSKEPIAGITPIEEMLAIPAKTWSEPPAKGLYLAAPGALPERLLALETGAAPSLLRAAADRPPLGALAGAGIAPTWGPALPALPVVLSGLEPGTLALASGWFRSFGLAPLAAAGVSRAAAAPPAELAAEGNRKTGPQLGPGSPVAVELIRGDLNVAAYGTVTSRQGDQLLAFGHPLFSAGSVDFPLAAASVVTVMPSVASSFKLSTLGPTVGALEQDRASGVYGRLGRTAPMVPLRVGLKRGSNPIEAFSFELATHRLLTPVLVEMALLNTLSATEKLIGASSLELSGRIDLAGHEPVVLDHFFSGDQAGPGAASLVALLAAVLLGNDFENTRIDGITLTLGYLEDNQFAVLDRVGCDRSRVRPGETVRLKAFLKRLREGEDRVELELKVPEGMPEGPLEVVVGDAVSLARYESRSQRYAPRTLDQLVALINSFRKGSSVHALLTRPDLGVAVKGAKLGALPPSAYALLAGSDSSETLLPIRRWTIAETSAPAASQVSGLKVVRLQVDGGRE